MAGDEPSEDAEAGADAEDAADGASEGGVGEDPTSVEPASGESSEGAREDAPPGAGPEDDTPDEGTPDEDDSRGESADETDPDDPGRSTDDVTDVGGTDGDAIVDGEADGDEAVEAEAEALVEEMEAAVAEAEPAAVAGDDDAEGSDDADEEDGDAAEDADAAEGDADAAEEEPTGAPPDAEMPPMAPDHEADPGVDPAAPPAAGDAEMGVPEDDGEPLDHAGPVVEDADGADGVLGGGPSGPAEDREMPLADHIREMLQRLAVVVAVAGLVSLLVIPFAVEIINFLWYSILPGVESEIARPRLYGVLVLWFTRIKVASIAGLIVALPVMVYETYAFMRPGLYPHERRYYLAAIPTSLVLAIVGVAFAYFVVLPTIFVYFLYYSQDVATIGFALGRTFDLILLMMGYLAVVFQIPLFIMLAMMMGLVTRRWLADRRLLFWMAFLGISFLFSFDPTGMAPIIVAATMIVLFEGTLLLTKWTGRE